MAYKVFKGVFDELNVRQVKSELHRQDGFPVNKFTSLRAISRFGNALEIIYLQAWHFRRLFGVISHSFR